MGSETAVLRDIVYPAVDEFARELEPGQALPKSPETQFSGPKASLSSLDLVNFLLVVEEHARTRSGKAVAVVSEKAMSRSQSPFRTLGLLAEFVGELVG